MSAQRQVTITVPIEEVEPQQPQRPLIFRVLDWLNNSNEVRLYLTSVAGCLAAATLSLLGYFDWESPPDIPVWLSLAGRVAGPMLAVLSTIVVLFAAGRASTQELIIADLKRQLHERSSEQG